MSDYILVLDEGTTSTRAMLFASDGVFVASAQKELTQHYPQAGWVEHDAGEIWDKTLECALDVVSKAGGAAAIAAIGITNQRETVVAWDTSTGEPLTRAIVWQDRRTEPFCAELRAAGKEAEVQAAPEDQGVIKAQELRDLRAARDDLERGDNSDAVRDQMDALDSLNEGAESLAQQMENGQGQQNAQGNRRGDGRPGNNLEEDPFDRPRGGTNEAMDGQRLGPEHLRSKAERARELMRELRDRAAQPSRPQLELDYLDRLMERF